MENRRAAGKKIVFVVNPISGDKQKGVAKQEIERFCRENYIPFHLFNTTGKEDAEKITRIIKDFSPAILVAVGGDGTVNLCAEILKDFKAILLGILPLGSGNGLAKDLNIPQNDVTAALNLLLKPSHRAIDTLEANGHFFVHMCDIGFNARIVECYTADPKRGLSTYAYHMIREFFKYRSSRYTIATDDKKPFKVKAFMITVANSNKFGSNIVINPEGKMDDGFFEVVIIKAFPNIQIPKLVFQILFKRIQFSPYSRIITAKQVKITHSRPKTLQVDGELLGKYKEIKVNIHAQSLKVIAPND